jgi:F420-non-reducing hydrogenase large subunit
MKRISIDPITRLEGHGKIEIFLDDAGDVANVYFQIPELRGFERFCVGRPVEELARITPRICGVCPEAHHIASSKAIDAVFGVEPAPAGRMLRELLYNAFFVTDHATHFYVLAGPDFIMGPESEPALRNILGVINKVGMETAGAVINRAPRPPSLISMIGGKQIHPVLRPCPAASARRSRPNCATAWCRSRPAWSSSPSSRSSSSTMWCSANSDYVDLIKSDAFTHETYYMGLVDAKNRGQLYDGAVRVVGPDGAELEKSTATTTSTTSPSTSSRTATSPTRTSRPLAGRAFVDGPDSGSTAPRRSAVSTRPMAWRRRWRRPSTSASSRRSAANRARHAGHALGAPGRVALRGRARPRAGTDPEIINPNVANHPRGIVGRGLSASSRRRAGRSTITTRPTDAGIVTNVNLIVGTTNNNAAISMSLKKGVPWGLITGGSEVGEGTLNMIEMAFRGLRPVLRLVPHTLPGHMPLEVTVRSQSSGEVISRATRHV